MAEKKDKVYLIVNNENNTKIEITPDEYGLILDALYEQSSFQKENGQKSYAKECIKIAKKFEKMFE